MYSTKQAESFRYAQLQSSIMNKPAMSMSSSSWASSSGGKVNLKGKFAHIESEISSIEADLNQLKADTNNTLRYVQKLNTDVADRELGEIKNKISEQVKKLDKNVQYGIGEAQKRSERIWNQCQARFQASENLKNHMEEIRNRITRLQNTLGYHSVAENVL